MDILILLGSFALLCALGVPVAYSLGLAAICGALWIDLPLEAIMLNDQGYVAECTADNVFIVHKGELITPAASQGALKGITRSTIIDIGKVLDLPVREADMTRYDIWCADECFLTGSGAEVIPVVKLDGRVIGAGTPGPITQRIMNSFRQRVRVEGTRV